MTTIRKQLWLWGQSPGTHHLQMDNAFQLPGENKMTSLEGCYYFGIPNCCRVVFEGYPTIPYDREAMVLDTLDQVVWSIADYGRRGRPDDGDADVREIIRQAKKHSNITGVIMDDFFVEEAHLAKYPPEKLAAYRQKLNTEVGRPLDLWVVVYAHELKEELRAHLACCDVITLWTWDAKDLPLLEEKLAYLQALCPGKRIYAGCYMWDYGGRCAIPDELMDYQLDTYYSWLHEGKIEGMIVCSNCVADLGLSSTELVRRWIQEHGEEVLSQ